MMIMIPGIIVTVINHHSIKSLNSTVHDDNDTDSITELLDMYNSDDIDIDHIVTDEAHDDDNDSRYFSNYIIINEIYNNNY